MLRKGFVTLWRVIIFVAMVLLAYETSFFLFPYIGHHTPLLPAIIIMYSLFAYVLVPLLFRLFRLISRANHVPTHVTTGDGWPVDPVNIAMTVKNRRHLVRAMKAAGWHESDKLSLRNDIRAIYAFLFDKPYPEAPLSRLYMFGRPQDVSFQIPVGTSPRVRHHVRFWRVDPRMPGTKQHRFWWNTLRNMVGAERELWVGSATFDSRFIGIKWRNLQITHQISSDTDKERDFLIKTLEDTNHLRRTTDVKAGEPYQFRGQNFGITITSDGYIKLCELKRPLSLYVKNMLVSDEK